MSIRPPTKPHRFPIRNPATEHRAPAPPEGKAEKGEPMSELGVERGLETVESRGFWQRMGCRWKPVRQRSINPTRVGGMHRPGEDRIRRGGVPVRPGDPKDLEDPRISKTEEKVERATGFEPVTTSLED